MEHVSTCLSYFINLVHLLFDILYLCKPEYSLLPSYHEIAVTNSLSFIITMLHNRNLSTFVYSSNFNVAKVSQQVAMTDLQQNRMSGRNSKIQNASQRLQCIPKHEKSSKFVR